MSVAFCISAGAQLGGGSIDGLLAGDNRLAEQVLYGLQAAGGLGGQQLSQEQFSHSSTRPGSPRLAPTAGGLLLAISPPRCLSLVCGMYVCGMYMCILKA